MCLVKKKRCHGEKGNVVYELAKDKNVLSHSKKEDMTFTTLIQSNGEEIPNELSKKLTDFSLELYDSSENDDEKSSYAGSYGNYFAKK